MNLPQFKKYKIVRRLGHRFCFTVYAAVDRRSNKKVSLKILDESLASREDVKRNFLNTATMIRLLNSPNVYQVYDCGVEQGSYFIVSEAITDKPLSSLHQMRSRGTDRVNRVIDIFLKIGEALRHAHLRGMVHGLLNPHDIYISGDRTIKIDGFGFHWYLPYLLKSQGAESVYLAQYLAPEFFSESNRIDGRADIYSLGVMFFELVVGHAPFEGENVASILEKHQTASVPRLSAQFSGFPEVIDKFLNKSVTKHPEHRFINLKIFNDALHYLKKEISPFSTPASKVFANEPREYNELYYQKSSSNKPLVAYSLGILLVLIAVMVLSNADLRLSIKEQSEAIQNVLPETARQVEQDEEMSAANGDEVGDDPGSGAWIVPEVDSVENEFLTIADELDSAIWDSQVSEPEPEEMQTAQLEPPEEATDSPNNERRTRKSSTAEFLTGVNIMARAYGHPVEAADIFLNNDYKGQTDARGRILLTDLRPNQRVTLKIIKNGYLPTTDEIVLKRSKHPPLLSFELRPNHDFKQYRGKSETENFAYGSVTISLKNASEFGYGFVYIDDKIWPNSPNTTPLNLRLPAGPHKISVQRSGFVAVPKDTTVLVEKDQMVHAYFSLKKLK